MPSLDGELNQESNLEGTLGDPEGHIEGSFPETSFEGSLDRMALPDSPVFIDRAEGVLGLDGPMGPAGEPGPVGPEGPQGPQGVQGEKGDKGEQGDRGEQGDSGPQGEQGERGEPGPTGDVGPVGAVGETGEPGPRGDVGEAGPQGDVGETGPLGPVGPQGDPGPQGLQGLSGPAGEQGEPGAQGEKGDLGAEGERGADGQSAYDIAVEQGFEGTEEEWLKSLRGPKGPRGPRGVPGHDGASGMPGMQGPPGPTGPEGPQGLPGTGGGGGGGSTFGFLIYTYYNLLVPPPANSRLFMDNLDQTLATVLWIDNMTDDGIDAINFYRLVKAGDRVILQDKNDATLYQIYTATADPIFLTGYVELPVSWVEGAGALVSSQDILLMNRSESTGGGGGGDGDLNYLFNQPSPATTWDITHNLGKYPSTTVVDSSGSVVYGDVQHLSANHLQVSFSAGFSGQAFLN